MGGSYGQVFNTASYIMFVIAQSSHRCAFGHGAGHT